MSLGVFVLSMFAIMAILLMFDRYMEYKTNKLKLEKKDEQKNNAK